MGDFFFLFNSFVSMLASLFRSAVMYTSGGVGKLDSHNFFPPFFFLLGHFLYNNSALEPRLCLCVCEECVRNSVCVCRYPAGKISELTVRAVGESDPLGR